jgi:hypothetical protein
MMNELPSSSDVVVSADVVLVVLVVVVVLTVALVDGSVVAVAVVPSDVPVPVSPSVATFGPHASSIAMGNMTRSIRIPRSYAGILGEDFS